MSDPNEELIKALDKLEEFTQENQRDTTRYEDVKDLLHMLFFSQYRKEKLNKEQIVKKELIKSIGLVKTYLPLIEKYQQGTPEEQKFAETVTQTIDRYNSAVLSAKNEDNHLKLTIDPPARIAYRKMESSEGKVIENLFHSRKSSKKPLSQQELDTLKMKAIRLIESDSTFQEALLETIKERGVGSSEEIDTDGNTVTLMQTWSELPGEIHRIIGAFKRESKHSIPIKDSFKVFLESKQPGHPYPAQHMGWALCHWLVPSSVLWIDQIPLLQPIMERKKKMAQSLLPKGDKNLKARKLYRLKKSIFDEGRFEFLTFHQELAHAIARASTKVDNAAPPPVINRFYEELSKQKSPFEALSQANEEINKIFVELPFEKIEELRLSGKNDNLFTRYEEERYLIKNLYFENAADTTDFDRAKIEYFSYLGPIIGEASALLLKLQLSEKLSQKPPPLSDFELKLQACCYKHLLEFLDELDEETDIDDPHEKEALKIRMRMEIQCEIELFATSSFEDIDPFLQELTEETISYFHARFHSH